MRVMYLITGLRLGGAENQLALLAEHLQQANFTVLVVAMEPGGLVAAQIKEKGIDVAELHITGLRNLAAGYRNFKECVKRFQPDIIHSHMIHANIFARIFKLFNGGPKLVNTAHNLKEGNRLLMFSYRLTRKIPDWSTNVSKEAFEYFINKNYFVREKSSFIPNAIDLKTFDPSLYDKNDRRVELNLPADTFVFFSAGRLHPQKNQALLFRAFTLFHKQFTNAVLVIAGEGPLRQELSGLAASLGIAEQTHLIGRRSDMAELLAMSNCFVLSSDFEGFGLVIAEAMAMNKPVIATDCGGVKEVMGGFGKLIAAQRVTDLAEAMTAAYLTTPATMTSVATRSYIQTNYAVELIIKKWISLYYHI
jgi:glycosyltransferase involved in cell wall biosynthesis